MSRLVVISDPDTAMGFQLAGVEVMCAEDLQTARAHLLRLIEDPEVGLIGVSSHFLDGLDDAARRRIEAEYKPVVVALPRGGAVAGLASRRERLAALIRRAIGFHITFQGGEEGARVPGGTREG